MVRLRMSRITLHSPRTTGRGDADEAGSAGDWAETRSALKRWLCGRSAQGDLYLGGAGSGAGAGFLDRGAGGDGDGEPAVAAALGFAEEA